MSYNIETTPHFEKELKDLAKRYKSMKQDFGKFKDSLKEDPFQGVDLGGGLRKIRMAIDSKRKGKAGEPLQKFLPCSPSGPSGIT